MWGVPRYRIRAYVEGKKKARQRGPARSRNTFHLKRVRAEIAVLEGIARPTLVAPCRILLNDMTPSGILAFAQQQFVPGQKVAITLDAPRRFFVRGYVVACNRISMDTHVITGEPYEFRLAIRFYFESIAERDAVRAYCEEELARALYADF
jgi:hypothetical protein